jgi:predicted ATP-binding protein involved in virulence
LKEIDIDIVAKRMIYFEKESDKPVFFEQLSAGFKNIINLIGNIVIELSSSGSLEKLEDLHGIVVIDEIEAHLHPKMQRFLVEKLTKLFPKVQFIVSTHSPIPLSSVPKDIRAIFHVERTKEKGIMVERLDKIMEDKDLSANTLLTSPIFNFFN